jgi:hypothetical protein
MMRLLLSLCALQALVGCSQHQCDVDDDLRLFAGDGAIDCGKASGTVDRADVDKCATDAFADGKAFIARYEHMGVDSKTVVAVASNTDNKLKIFRWQSAPCGSQGCSPVTDVQSCEKPSAATMTSDDPNALPIECDSLGAPERICS